VSLCAQLFTRLTCLSSGPKEAGGAGAAVSQSTVSQSTGNARMLDTTHPTLQAMRL